VDNCDGRLCAEIIREFLDFYAMKHTLHVFVPEMSLESGFARTRREIEREAGITDTDAQKPLLLKLLEACKFGGGGGPMPGSRSVSPLVPGFSPEPQN